MKIAKEFYQDPKKEKVFTIKAGMNSFVWNMRYPNATAVDGTNVMWAGSGVGAKVVPGSYIVRLMKTKPLLQKHQLKSNLIRE
jgi:hypothetical protein